MENNVVNVAFILDDGFVIPTATAITSLIENKSSDTIYNIYLITNNLSKKNICLFEQFSNCKNITINIKNVDNAYNEFKINKENFKVTTTAIFKFNIPLILSELDKVLYIDGDTIIQKDLLGFYNIELNSYYAGVIKDLRPMYFYKPSIFERLNIQHKSYFNSGVMLLNLKKMRIDKITEKLFNYRKNGINYFMDQDSFNVVFNENVKYIEPFYNFILTNLDTFSFDEFLRLSKIKKDNIKSYNDFIKTCFIIHYASPQKPWIYKKTLKNELWYAYYKKSPIGNQKLKRINCKCHQTFIQKLFSISNDLRTKHKVITVLGLKLKIKLKLKDKFDAIISLTSYPARINTVEKTIKTLLNQTLKPKKIVLALGEDKFPNKENDLPESLRSLLSDKFEILWTPKDLRSYTKLVPALKEYPNDIIVTADDDIIYKKDWLEKLYEAYKKEPSLIHCHRAHRITFDKNKKIMPYREWVWGVKKVKPSFNNFLTGVGGVLYPPNVLNKDVFNVELFQKLAPLADDIWFWAMAVLNDTKINVIKHNNSSLVCIDGTQENCLCKQNVDESKNDEQLNNILEYYPQILEKLDKKKFRNVSFLQSLFSITNLPSKEEKWYRTVYFLGFKLSFRNKKKEEKMKILSESEGK